jgi:endonuclease YncB( thermonuclease family)
MLVPDPAYRYRATARRVIDGDTILADVDLGFYIQTTIRVRLFGVDTPELNRADQRDAAREAREYVLRLLFTDAGQPVPLILESYKDHRSFDRWVCRVWFARLNGPVDLAEALIAAGYGKRIEA